MGIGSLEDAIRQTNSQTYGLMAAIFTSDLAAGLRYADAVPMGLVNINETTNYWEPHLPWGGRARSQSGIGRVGGRSSDGHAHRVADHSHPDRLNAAPEGWRAAWALIYLAP